MRLVPDPDRAPHWADTCGSPGGCVLLLDPAFSFGDLPPTVGCPLPSQRFLPRSKDKEVYHEGQP